MSHPAIDRLEDLAVDEALGLLTPAEQSELRVLLQQVPGFDMAGVERAIAAVTAAGITTGHEPVPADLERKLLADAAGFLAGITVARPLEAVAQQSSLLRRAAGWSGWALAAGLAVVLWFYAIQPSGPVSANGVTYAGRRLEAARDRLLAEHGSVFMHRFAPGSDANGAALTGDVVWDDRTQQGYLRLRGLRVNDPSREQYQLWIFDAERDQRYPVDGGIFDIRGEGTSLVRIRAAVPVHHAVLFAITVEQPGGVVVSTRARLAGLAKPG
jgi:hypothetical protein